MNNNEDFPFEINLSFNKVLDKLRDRMESSKSSISKDYMQSLLDYAQSFPNLIEGISDFNDLDKYKDPIRVLLDNLFPAVLTKNEIKSAAVPFQSILFNPTKRFASILKNAGDDFELKVRNLDEDMFYILACIVILNTYYDKNLDFSKPLFYDIPDKKGLLRHYRIAMNADFVSLQPKEDAIEITDEIVNKLVQEVDNIDLWKQYFPPQSWILKGITILNLTDVTVEDAISELKTNLLYDNTIQETADYPQFQEIFQSIFNMADLKIGFTQFDEDDDSFIKMDKEFATSYILDKENRNDCCQTLCGGAYDTLIKNKKYFCISDVEQYAIDTKYNLLSENLLNQGVKSCILAPIFKGKKLLAVLELVSGTKNELNSVNAMKLDDIIPYIVATVERRRFETENRIKAVIQSECTSIHPSVLWVFEEEAKRFIANQQAGKFASFKDIAFKEVYPLYGQIDIVGSSEERNLAIQQDILIQLKLVDDILNMAMETKPLPIYEQVKFRIEEFIEDISQSLSASSETQVFNLLRDEVNPLLNHLNTTIPEIKRAIENYQAAIRPETGLIYENRRHYDETVQLINQELATFLDRKQQEAQKIFPHYFERYKTDGVDHNIYIGASMTRKEKFSMVYLYNLRLWQLRTMCEMENHFYHKQHGAKLQLDAASLILVFSTTLSIRYRMDEKKFDVDGTYNARYEIIKKRIDKALIRGTDERITQKGKIAIIYSQESDEEEYGRYIKYLQRKSYLGENVEYLELEDVQGVVGLKAIRIEVLYSPSTAPRKVTDETITYEDLIEILD